jgi:glycosyltransferase involved in cell wall biosynthesis
LNHLKQVVGEVSSEVIKNGVDTNFYRPDLPRPYAKGDPQLLFVGMLYPYKNITRLIDALPQILNIYPNAHLQIVGSGSDYRKLGYQINKMKLADNVELVGPAFGEELKLRYSSCDIYMSASQLEGFVLPPMEAMACGKPIILSDIPAHREILEQSGAGFHFPISGDNFFIADKIKLAYDEKSSLGVAARKFAEAHDWSNVCNRVSKVYEWIMLNKK